MLIIRERGKLVNAILYADVEKLAYEACEIFEVIQNRAFDISENVVGKGLMQSSSMRLQRVEDTPDKVPASLLCAYIMLTYILINKIQDYNLLNLLG